MSALNKTAYLLVLLGLLSGCPEPEAGPPGGPGGGQTTGDDDDSASVGDDDDSASESVTATVGPAGGEVELPGGVRLVVPAGALPEEADFTLSTQAPEATSTGMEDGAFQRILTPFGISPHVTSQGEPFQLLVPVPNEGLPGASTSAEIVLVPSGDGIHDSRVLGASVDRVHPVWAPSETDETSATFLHPTTTGANYQPMVRIVDEDDGARDHVLADFKLGHPCSEVLDGWLDPAEIPADIDTVVSLVSIMDVEVEAAYLAHAASPTDQQAFRDAVNRFLARICIGTYRSRAFYSGSMGLPAAESAPGNPAIPLAAGWSSTTDAVCGSLSGEANGTGITIFFNRFCQESPSYVGWEDASYGFPGYNTAPSAGVPNGSNADALEQTVAHELFHYVEDWADWTLENLHDAEGDDFPPGSGWREGGADAASEYVYDGPVDSTNFPATVWDSSAWDLAYALHPFWRYLDWTQESSALTDSVSTRVLTAVRARSTQWPLSLFANDPVLGEEVDAAIAAMFPDTEASWDREAVFPDFLGSLFYLHDFERDLGDGLFDGTNDVLGQQLDEEGDGALWGEWFYASQGYLPVRGNNIDPDPLEMAPTSDSDLPSSAMLGDLVSWGGGTVEIDLGAVADGVSDWAVTVYATDPSGDRAEDLPLRLYAHDTADPSSYPELIDSVDSLSVDETSPSALVVSSEAADFEIVLVAGNTGDEVLSLYLSIDRGSSLYVLGRGEPDGALYRFEVEDEALNPLGIGPSSAVSLPLDGKARSMVIGGPLGVEALVTGSDDYLAHFMLPAGAEYELSPRLDLSPWGSTPRGLGVTSDAEYAVVALDEAVILVDLIDWEVVGWLTGGPLELAGDERPWDVAVLPDDSKAYISLWAYPDPTDRILVVDVQEMVAQSETTAFDGLFDEVTALYTIDVGGSTTNPLKLALDPSGSWLAATLSGTSGVALVDTSTDTLVDVAPSLSNTVHYLPDPQFEPSNNPQWVAWAEDSSGFYVGYAGGYVGGRLQAYGTVRRCLLSEEHCGHEVGVDNPVRGLTPHGSGASRVVWVLDSLGSLTPLADALFDATPTTSGTDPAGKFDGTGGCVTWDGFFDWIAEPCPSAASIGMAGSELGFLP